MQANGQAKRSELDFVKDYIKKAFPTEDDQKYALQLLKELLEQNIDVEGVARQVAKQMNIYHKRELIYFLLGIGYADGMLQRSEDSVILKISVLLGISHSDYNSIKTSYFAGENNGGSFYGNSYSQKTAGGSYQKTGGSSYSGSSSGSKSGGSGSGSRARRSINMSLSTAYSLLGLTSTATNEEVVKAYRSMCKKFHPDRVATLGESVVKEAEEHMMKINQAYDLIKSERNM